MPHIDHKTYERLQEALTENTREKLTARIQGLLDRGAAKDFGGDQEPGRHEGSKRKNSGHERIAERVPSGPLR